MEIGLDVGFGHTKVVSDGRKLKFPTWIAFPSRSAISEAEEVKVGSESMVVGEDAKYEPRRVEISSISTLIRYAPYFLKYVINRLGEEPKMVVSGLPPAHKDKREDYKEALRSVLKSGEVEVILQGMGILKDVEDKLGEDALIIDVGFNTVDYLLVVRHGEKWRYRKGNTIEEHGVLRAVEAFRENIPDELGYVKNLSLSRLIEVFEKGEITIQGMKKRLPDIKEIAVREFTNALISRLISEIGNALYEVETIVIAGGGANLIDRNLIEHTNVIIPEEPEFSNARGYHKIAKQLTGEVS